jgi:opacity protein-like surface antigen
MKKVLLALVLAAAPVWASQTAIVVQNNMFNCDFFGAFACIAGVNAAVVVQLTNSAVLIF